MGHKRTSITCKSDKIFVGWVWGSIVVHWIIKNDPEWSQCPKYDFWKIAGNVFCRVDVCASVLGQFSPSSYSQGSKPDHVVYVRHRDVTTSGCDVSGALTNQGASLVWLRGGSVRIVCLQVVGQRAARGGRTAAVSSNVIGWSSVHGTRTALIGGMAISRPCSVIWLVGVTVT